MQIEGKPNFGEDLLTVVLIVFHHTSSGRELASEPRRDRANPLNMKLFARIYQQNWWKEDNMVL